MLGLVFFSLSVFPTEVFRRELTISKTNFLRYTKTTRINVFLCGICGLFETRACRNNAHLTGINETGIAIMMLVYE